MKKIENKDETDFDLHNIIIPKDIVIIFILIWLPQKLWFI